MSRPDLSVFWIMILLTTVFGALAFTQSNRADRSDSEYRQYRTLVETCTSATSTIEDLKLCLGSIPMVVSK